MTARCARCLAAAALCALPVCARAQRADAVALRRPAVTGVFGIAPAPAPAPAAAPRLAFAAGTANAAVGNVIARPDLEPARIAGELLVGSYGGIGGFLVGRYAGMMLADIPNDVSENTRDGVAFAGGVLGAWMGTTVGVYGIGSIGNQAGSFGTTAFGAGVGAVAGVFLDKLVFAPRRSDPSAGASSIRWGETIVESFLPAIGATIAFNSSRKYK